MKRLVSLCLVAAFLAVPATFAAAQGEFDEEGRRIYYKPKTEIDINEGVTIDGVSNGPRIKFLRGSTPDDGPPLLKLRQDFDPEILSSVDQI